MPGSLVHGAVLPGVQGWRLRLEGLGCCRRPKGPTHIFQQRLTQERSLKSYLRDIYDLRHVACLRPCGRSGNDPKVEPAIAFGQLDRGTDSRDLQGLSCPVQTTEARKIRHRLAGSVCVRVNIHTCICVYI